ncbi:PDR/VanB family oxidoreductase [Streptomyces globisporus]|uniref:PDR/VanB family oxidoreductase n=1 Tax=Streptomyces globisporus TaxID=1908 RepID=UPI0004C4DA73|nr:PDR/VanB family oxidoreductase [Streptomyces globisporus]
MSTTEENPFDLLVRRMTWEADDVLSVELVSPYGKPLPDWTPGAHIDLHAGDQVRQYSLCGDPADTTYYRIAVLKSPDSRGGSSFVHDELRPGATVTVRGPRNHFALADADAYVFVAGGIGVTPLLAQAREAGVRGKPWQLWYAGRSRSTMAFGEELTALAAHGGTVELHPKDERGRMDLRQVLGRLPEGAHVYCCGPQALMDGALEVCEELGIADRLHVERFAGVAVPAPEGGESSFEVECVRSGQTVTVGPDESIVDVLDDAGIYVDASCREGVCGTCETGVLDGVPDHRDSLLSPAEQEAGDVMMICVSRCASKRLVLDI